MDQIIGILPNIMKIVEIPGNGERKKKVVMNAIIHLLKKLKLYHPYMEILLSILIDELVKILFPKK
jgi:hypothetical protein